VLAEEEAAQVQAEKEAGEEEARLKAEAKALAKEEAPAKKAAAADKRALKEAADEEARIQAEEEEARLKAGTKQKTKNEAAAKKAAAAEADKLAAGDKKAEKEAEKEAKAEAKQLQEEEEETAKEKAAADFAAWSAAHHAKRTAAAMAERPALYVVSSEVNSPIGATQPSPWLPPSSEGKPAAAAPGWYEAILSNLYCCEARAAGGNRFIVVEEPLHGRRSSGAGMGGASAFGDQLQGECDR